MLNENYTLTAKCVKSTIYMNGGSGPLALSGQLFSLDFKSIILKKKKKERTAKNAGQF